MMVRLPHSPSPSFCAVNLNQKLRRGTHVMKTFHDSSVESDVSRGPSHGECRPSRTSIRPLLCVVAAFACSLIKTILNGRGELAQGDDLETVGVQVSDYISKEISGQRVKFYDLAGQHDYYGLHQFFMTERAVYVMTWDASEFLWRKEVHDHQQV